MRYLNEREILPYLHAGKEIEQFLGEFYFKSLKCIRYVTLGYDKDGYYALLFEKYDDSDEGINSVYDFSSIEPDDLYGKEIGPYKSLIEVLDSINRMSKLNPNKYLMSGNLDEDFKNQ